MAPPELIEEVARAFALLGDPGRLRILCTLIERGELSGGETAAASGTSRFNAFAHLNRLARGGLVLRRQAGTTHYYRVCDSNLRNVREAMRSAMKERAQVPTA